MATLQGAPVTDNTGATQFTTRTISVTVAAGNRRCMAVCVSGEGDGTATQAEVTGITYGGVALTKLTRVERTDWSWTEVWYLIAPAVGTANVVVTVSEADKFVTGIYVADDVNQTSPLLTPYTQNNSGTGASGTVSGVGASDLLFDSLGLDSTGALAAVGADQTERWDIETSSGASTGASSTQPGSAGGVMSWTWTTSRPMSYIATGFIHDGGGGTTHTLTPADTMTLADSLSKRATKTVADTMALADALSNRVTKAVADSMALADALVKRYALQPADTLALADVLSKRMALPFADTVALADALTRRFAISPADSMALADSLNASIPGAPSGVLLLRMWTGYGL